MPEVKTAECVGVQDIVRINVECPECGHVLEIPYSEFIKNAGEPWYGCHEGHAMTCPECEMYFELGPFRLEE